MESREWRIAARLVLISVVLLFPTTVSADPDARAQTASASATYRVRIDPQRPLRALVVAELPVSEGRLAMVGWGADQRPRGWASFVERLEARDLEGRTLDLVAGDGAEWTIAGRPTGRVRLTYEVDFAFAEQPWPAGNEQAALYRDGSLYTVTKALFIATDAVGPSVVSFEVPPSWKISTPWEPDATGRTFHVRSREDLVENSLVVGSHTERTFRVGDFTCTMALLGPMAESDPLLSEVVGRVVAYYGTVFPKTPPSRYLLTLFLAEERDAEAFRQSCAMSEPRPPDRQGLALWGSSVAHELFHAWNGHAIRAEDYASTQWFSEGFTEYFANLALARTGLITEEQFLDKASRNLSLYLFFRWSPAFSSASLKDAGGKKSLYRPGVYNGGWSVAFCLDSMLVDESAGKRSLADVMRLMYERYGLTSTKYSYEQLVQAVSDVSGRDMAPFFARYVSGREVLPVAECLARIGLEGYGESYSAEYYVYRDPSASASAVRGQRAMIHGR